MYKELIQLNNKQNKTIQLKNVRGTEQTFFQRRYANGQQVPKKILITNHQRNAK